ncbi:MAG: type I restriction-modification system subunit M N-terminal domain-containing protein [Sulfurimonas sp.]|nr:type I restriction-modification system subunit M N-terminal domain-containing protein [Sulfurimonas sp.]
MNKLTLEILERWLWDSADLMRGHIDSSDFKNYIFGLLFLKRANDQFMEEANIAVARCYYHFCHGKNNSF